MDLIFSLSSLNQKAPYRLEVLGHYAFRFVTSAGKTYEIGFIQDYMISDENVYQFFISTEDQFKTHLDSKIQQTIMVVLEEFFSNEGVVLDYICATEDHRQATRDRLFRLWFASFFDKENYNNRHLSVDVDGVPYYASVVLRRDNPRYADVMYAIDKFEKEFRDKLND
jgi:hypothetical protein